MQPNPYYGVHFFEFFVVFFKRLFSLKIQEGLFPDEIQLLVLSLLALSGAIVGTFLMLRKMVMLANSLSHTILAGIVIAFVVKTAFFTSDAYDFHSRLPSQSLLLFSSLIMAFLTTFLTEFLVRTMRLPEDMSTALVFTFLFGFGVIAVTALSKNAHIGAELLMGNADGLELQDAIFIFWITLANLILFTLCYRGYVVTTFDPIYAKVLGVSSSFFGYLLMLACSVTCIGGFRAVGVLLLLAFFIIPVVAARLWSNRLRTILYIACFFGILAAFCGVALSRHILSLFSLSLSTGGIVVLVLLMLYLFSALFAKQRGILFQGLIQKGFFGKKQS